MYLLMNKNTVVAKFDVNGNGTMEYISILSVNDRLVPSWINKKELETFISNRKAPKHRQHIDLLLKRCGCDTISGYLRVSHALSLNDTFWVKEDKDIGMTWENVSLYRNKFNQVIAKIAFDGGMYGEQFSSTSPELNTGGTFAKCWVREDGIIKLLKKGSSGAANAGLEPFSEYYSCQILDALGIEHVDYSLHSSKGEYYTKCRLFTDEKYGYIPYSAVSKNGNIGQVVDFYRRNGVYDDVADMLIADSVMLNEDRHLGNFGFIVDNDTGNFVDTAPLHDHNISLLCYAMESDFGNIYQYMSMLNKGPKLGGDFIALAKELMTPRMRIKLNNMYGFKFKKHTRHNLPEWRLEELSKIVNYQIRMILS